MQLRYQTIRRSDNGIIPGNPLDPCRSFIRIPYRLYMSTMKLNIQEQCIQARIPQEQSLCYRQQHKTLSTKDGSIAIGVKIEPHWYLPCVARLDLAVPRFKISKRNSAYGLNGGTPPVLWPRKTVFISYA